MIKYTGKKGNYAFHFVADNLRDGRPIPTDGEWLEHKGPIAICRSGLHASFKPSDALKYAPGATLCLVKLSNIEGKEEDKIVARKRKIIARFDATQLLRDDARASARACLKNWQGEIPQAVKDWLTTGDETFRSAARSAAWSAAESAARSAAWSAARSAARSAAESAARSAARSAAESAANKRLNKAILAHFVKMKAIRLK